MVFTAFRTHFARRNHQHFHADRQLVTKKEKSIKINFKKDKKRSWPNRLNTGFWRWRAGFGCQQKKTQKNKNKQQNEKGGSAFRLGYILLWFGLILWTDETAHGRVDESWRILQFQEHWFQVIPFIGKKIWRRRKTMWTSLIPEKIKLCSRMTFRARIPNPKFSFKILEEN